MSAQPNLDLPRFLTVSEFARLAARNRFTVYHQAKHEPEKLPRVTRLYGRVLFLDSDVRAWFATVCAHSTTESPSGGPERRRGRPRKAAGQGQAVTRSF